VVVSIADVIRGGPGVARPHRSKCVGDDEDFDFGNAVFHEIS